MLKPSSFTPVVALARVVLFIFMKDDYKNNIGTILMGFAVLMFGMETMSSAVKPLAEIPEFTNLFTAFENPILGMAACAVLMALIQSLSALVDVLQAMCVTVQSALPIIMGQNIGTCITALLSGVDAGSNARRASLVYLYFNLIGTFLFMGVFYAVNAFVHFYFLSDAATGASIAIIHSIFNIVTTAILLPFSGKIEKLAYLMIPVTDNKSVNAKQKGSILDERFLERPAFAVAQCKSAVCEVAKLTEEAMALIHRSTISFQEEDISRVFQIEESSA